MSNYSRGYNFERRISAHLRSEGYYVLESRGSHGVVDLVAVKLGQILAVQAKTDGALSPLEWNSLYAEAKQYGMVPILACREGRRLVLWRLTGVKVAYDRNPPRELWTADEVAAA